MNYGGSKEAANQREVGSDQTEKQAEETFIREKEGASVTMHGRTKHPV